MNGHSLANLLICLACLQSIVEAFPIGAANHHLRDDVPSEPNVVMQSVVVGKKPRLEVEDCSGGYGGVNLMARRLLHVLRPQYYGGYRYKRDGEKKEEDKPMRKLMEALEEIGSEPEAKDEREEGTAKWRRDDPFDEGDEYEHGRVKCEGRGRRRANSDEEGVGKDRRRRWKKDKKTEDDRKKKMEELADSWPRKPGEECYVPLHWFHGTV